MSDWPVREVWAAAFVRCLEAMPEILVGTESGRVNYAIDQAEVEP